MSNLGNSANSSEIFNENNLPVELQTQNVINPVYTISAIPTGNGPVKTNTNIGYNGK